jgi:hypothetical protein
MSELKFHPLAVHACDRYRYVRDDELRDLIAELEEEIDELECRPKVTDYTFAALERALDYLCKLREAAS